MRGGLRGNQFIGILIAFSCVLAIAGCGDKGKVIEETRRHLKDPDSAKFGDVVIVDSSKGEGFRKGMKLACVTVNSKNSYGGYTGDKQAMLLLHGDVIEFVDISDITPDLCVQVARENLKSEMPPSGTD